MSISKLKNIKNDIRSLAELYDTQCIFGPIEFLEEAIDNIDNAIDEYKQYESENKDD